MGKICYSRLSPCDCNHVDSVGHPVSQPPPPPPRQTHTSHWNSLVSQLCAFVTHAPSHRHPFPQTPLAGRGWGIAIRTLCPHPAIAPRKHINLMIDDYGPDADDVEAEIEAMGGEDVLGEARIQVHRMSIIAKIPRSKRGGRTFSVVVSLPAE